MSAIGRIGNTYSQNAKVLDAYYAAIETGRFGHYFSRELSRMARLADLGLIEVRPGELQVIALGWYFVRAVAMAFDGYLGTAGSGASYSRIV